MYKNSEIKYKKSSFTKLMKVCLKEDFLLGKSIFMEYFKNKLVSKEFKCNKNVKKM